MATAAKETTTTTEGPPKTQLKVLQTQPTKTKRRKYKEITISSAASAADIINTADSVSGYCARRLDPPIVVSPDNSWCCSASWPVSTPQPPPPPSLQTFSRYPHYDSDLSDCAPTLRIRFLPERESPVMESSCSVNLHSPSSFSKFNSALTAGLLNPMTPPPDKTRSNPTLFEMMSNEIDLHPKTQTQLQIPVSGPKPTPVNKQALALQRISDLLSTRSPGNQFNDPTSSDIKLTMSSKDGFSFSVDVHKHILVSHSRFFAGKLADRPANRQQPQRIGSAPYIVEISDCDDVEVYIETIRLIYCNDLRKMLMKEDVSKVLGILKVSAAIGFDGGILSCLEYLEAAPWSEEEDEKVASLLAELRLENDGAGEVLKRVSVERKHNGTEETSTDNEAVLLRLLNVVLEGKDEKARREMKGLVFKLLNNETSSSSRTDLLKKSLYAASDTSLRLLRLCFLQAADSDMREAGQISRQADNLQWILDILIDRQIAEEFLRTWANESELSKAHSKVPVVYRHEVSRVTARLFVGIGKGQLLASKEMRCLVIETWLVPFYDDFGWLRRGSKGLDRHLIEEVLSNTILTLPLAVQEDVFLAWFDRYVNSGDDCPNIQRGFEVWWRRVFRRRDGEPERSRRMRVVNAAVEEDC